MKMKQIIKDKQKSISNLEIEGVLFIVEDISYTNTLPKRNLNRMKIINGTEVTTRGEYVPLEFEITTTINVPVNRPDFYSDSFLELQSKICNVVSPLMGSFKAELTINYEQSTPESIKVRIHIVEVPGEYSNIPGEKIFKIPEDKLETEEHKKEREKAKESKKDVNSLIEKAKQLKKVK